ncbi:MAG TPA: MoxR family ATPase [Candidatus Baltobacteraceae bacterium]|nr:MoxR family ATPase [Candidatus Baltobacteraceae bacterium]
MSAPRGVLEALHATIVGQNEVCEALVLALIAGGHVLLEGAPGVAKTLACRALAAAVGGVFRRVQFTPDLLPSDIVGTRVFDQKTGEFATVLGPLFANVVLADEINRAPAKVQSALLEGMQERRATIGPQTHALPDPFVVLATMNPYDSDGTYPLPHAQLDRFLAKVVVEYPSRDEERAIVDRFGAGEPPLPTGVATTGDVLRWQREAREVFVDAALRDYAVELVRATRDAELVAHGASPRAALALVQLGRARAYLDARGFATPDDVRDVAPAVLRHRLSWDDRIALEGTDPEAIVHGIVRSVPAP